MLDPTLDAVAADGCSPTSRPSTSTVATTSRPYAANSPNAGSTDTIQRNAANDPAANDPNRLALGLRWIVEATNTWWSNYGQLRRNTDRKTRHRHAALCLATTILIVGKLITYRDRWSANLTAYPRKSLLGVA